MYAVVETGGKQYRVELGSEFAVERLEGAPGETVNLDRVLLVADGDSAQVGTPTVADALVTASVVRQDRGEKLIVFKYRPKARHRTKKGHRQEQTVLRVADIQFNGRSAAKEAGEQEKQESKSRKAASEAAEQKAAADQELAAKLAAQETATAEATEATAADTAAEAPAKKTSTRSAKSKATVEATPETEAEDAPAESEKTPAKKAPAARSRTSTTKKKDE
jgi:large subunit ribosomal protein L21